jgi:uncharacterized protein
MNEKKNNSLIKKIAPKMNQGQFVFITTNDPDLIQSSDIILQFREREGTTFVLERKLADQKGLTYNFVAAWITLNVYSSLEAVGLTAKVSVALAKESISCNAVAAYYHDHIFVPYRDADRAISVLRKLD